MKGKKFTLLALLLATSALTGCNNEGIKDKKDYTYKDYTAVSPSNWNELTYQDNNDTQIMSYLGSSFFSYDFMFDDEGQIIDGKFTVNYDAATKLEDVTTTYAGNEKYAVPQDAEDGYAYKITLREDLEWDDGTPIKAEDFVYTMQEQLNPLFQNYRADSFYVGATVIHNAKGYNKQGITEPATARDKHAEWNDAAMGDSSLYFTLGANGGVGGFVASSYGSYLSQGATPAWVVSALGCAATEAELLSLEGKTWAEIQGSDELKGIWEKALKFWKTLPNEELDFFCYDYTYPQMSMEDVGIFVGDSEYELVVVLDKYLSLLNEDGSLSYKAAYNFSSLPLVHKVKYEANKHEPSTTKNWTSTYNSSVETSASWGPYKLTEFQAGKHYTLSRNENWYGYETDLYKGQYQTDYIDVETIAEYNTAFMKFQAGQLNGIGIDVSVADEYKNSERAIYTGDDYVGSLQLQSDVAALKERETDGVNKTILANVKFRNAISLAIDREDYANKVTTAQKPGFGIFNSYHYYDVANGGVYRYTDEGRKALCEAYGVDVSKFASLEEAADSITGYAPEAAKRLVEEAYQEELAAGNISATDKVSLSFGTSTDSESTRRVYNYLSNALVEMVKGTSLEGRLETTFEDHQSKWADDFRDGKYDVCTGGWSGAAWDPGYFLLAYLSPDYMYSTAWDTANHMMTYLPEGAKDIDGNPITEELTMSLLDWYDALNGAHPDYNWAEGAVETSVRLGLISAIETQILCQYYTVPITYYYSASLLSYQCEYITTTHNTFMGYGGLRYLTYNYDDVEWAEYLESNTLDYKG